MRITLHVLEPFGRVARRVLDLQDLDGALGLVGAQRGAQVGLLLQGAREGDRILERELGARAYGKMRGVRRVAEEHDGDAGAVADPRLVDDPQEVDPR